ncbi:hypothetical protein BC834DRAFT_656941 [Gloeopeniophorella convolvens]|nr:hypothetical protein BC834DRAFT_656941 [Gloeopeniophorella convolvens]
MSSSVFALIIGIDQYKSSKIWNLSSCIDDAFNVKRWLTDDLHVPRDHICTLLDGKATQAAIEDAFMSHLVNNPAIETGDSIVIYFAGHGSNTVAPDGWRNGNPLHVETLCPYDHGTRVREGRVAGITDWSMQAMLSELSEAKGDNITLILDCCFSPARSRLGAARKSTRWTPSSHKITADDLYTGLWRGALGRKVSPEGHGFYQKATSSHVTILACDQGERAMEDKEGGRFTRALLEAKDTKSFHRTSYGQLVGDLFIHGESQHPVCVGKNKKRILFGGTPFTPDTRFVPAASAEKGVIRISAGAIHGVVEGTEFSLHEHNVRGSLNPAIATLQATSVHPTWCLSKIKTAVEAPVAEGWARVTRWNNRIPFKVHLKRTCTSFKRWWQLRQELPGKQQRDATPGGCTIMRVTKAEQADLSVQPHDTYLTIERKDPLVADNCPPVIHAETHDAADDVQVLDAAANFHLHLHRRNSQVPLGERVSMELRRLDAETWAPTGANLLADGRATLAHDDGALYALTLSNRTDVDLWPYLFWMDATGYAIRPVYQPAPGAAGPPLPRGGALTIGTGRVGSEALAFRLGHDEPANSCFLKLFLSTAYAPMHLVEQAPLMCAPPQADPAVVAPAAEASGMPRKELWDTMMACVTIVRE